MNNSHNLIRQNLHRRLQQVFQDVFDNQSIVLNEATTAQDIKNWDSLMHVTLVLAVEREFCIRLDAAEIGQLQNVGKMLDLLESRGIC